MTIPDGTRRPGDGATPEFQAPLQLRNEPLSARIQEYLPPQELLGTPTLLDKKRKERMLEQRPGDVLAVVVHEGKPYIVPSWHPLNTEVVSGNASVYGSASMATMNLEPHIDSANEIDGANVVLLGPRLGVLYGKALPTRQIMQPPLMQEQLAQGIVDLAAVLGEGVLRNAQGELGRGSIRVTVAPGLMKFGVGEAIPPEAVNMTVEVFHWKGGFKERAYTGAGITINVGPNNQRLTKLDEGKHASAYGNAADITAESKRVGADKALMLDFHHAHNRGLTATLTDYEHDPETLLDRMLHLAIADGLGEEVFAIRKDGTLVFPPVGDDENPVNRLNGTTAAYLEQHIAPSLGIATIHENFSIQDMLDGDIVGFGVAGNSARIGAIGEIILNDGNGNILFQGQLEVPPRLRELIETHENLVRGVVPPEDNILLTPVDLEEGRKARAILEQAYAAWMN